jgi:hypothetical protein
LTGVVISLFGRQCEEILSQGKTAIVIDVRGHGLNSGIVVRSMTVFVVICGFQTVLMSILAIFWQTSTKREKHSIPSGHTHT